MSLEGVVPSLITSDNVRPPTSVDKADFMPLKSSSIFLKNCDSEAENVDKNHSS